MSFEEVQEYKRAYGWEEDGDVKSLLLFRWMLAVTSLLGQLENRIEELEQSKAGSPDADPNDEVSSE